MIKTNKIFSGYICIAFIFWISIVIASTLYKYTIEVLSPQDAHQIYLELIQYTADAPTRYRILVPAIVEIIAAIISGEPYTSFLLAYFIYYQFSIVFSLTFLFLYIRSWYSDFYSLIGIFVVAISMLVAFGDGYFQPWSLLEIGLFSACLFAIYKHKTTWLMLIVALATFNRETGLFFALAYLVIHLKNEFPFITKKHFMWASVYFVIWGCVYVYLRLWLGYAPQLSLMRILQINFTKLNVLRTVVNISLFLGAYWLLLWAGFKVANSFVLATWRIVPIYLVAYLIFGIWLEVRLLTFLYPVLIPTGLGVLDKISQRPPMNCNVKNERETDKKTVSC